MNFYLLFPSYYNIVNIYEVGYLKFFDLYYSHFHSTISSWKLVRKKPPESKTRKHFLFLAGTNLFFSRNRIQDWRRLFFFLWWNFQKENAAAVEQRVEWSFDKKNCCNSLFMVHQMGKWEWRQGDGWGKIGEGK